MITEIDRARGEALDRETSGTRKIDFLKGNEIHSPTLLKHENVFYRVKKGDLFGVAQETEIYVR